MVLKSSKMAKKTIRITCGLGAEIVAKEITVIKKKVVTEEEQKQQVADELLNELSNNREAVEETMQLFTVAEGWYIRCAISLLVAKEDVSKSLWSN